MDKDPGPSISIFVLMLLLLFIFFMTNVVYPKPGVFTFGTLIISESILAGCLGIAQEIRESGDREGE